jgi:hypothetical protein
MSTLSGLYRELIELNARAQRHLERGDLAALDPIFEQKARLASEIGQIDLRTAPDERAPLLALQAEAAFSESNLVKALQPFVSSNENKAVFRPQKGASRPGQGFDFLG